MDRERLLLSGPHSANLRREALRLSEARGVGVWIVPSPLAKSQVLEALTESLGSLGESCRVLTWDDLWDQTIRLCPEVAPPWRISDASRRLLIGEAIEEARRADELPILGEIVDRPGFRRLLSGRFAAWSQSGQSFLPGKPRPADVEEWRIYRRFVSRMVDLNLTEPPQFEGWASRLWEGASELIHSRFSSCTILDPGELSVAQRRVADHLMRWCESLVITMPVAPDRTEELTDPSPWIDGGFEIRRFDPVVEDSFTLPSLELQFESEHEPPIPTEGLKILGGPGSEGQARLVASSVLSWLAEGHRPAEAVVLVPSWNVETRAFVDHLRDFGVPVASPPPLSLRNAPAIIACLHACRLPFDNWPVDSLIRLLRHGLVTQSWTDSGRDQTLAEVAHIIGDLQIFRGLDPLLVVLNDKIREGGRSVGRYTSARTVVESLAELLRTATRGTTWSDRVQGISLLSDRLGLMDSPDGAAAIETLLDLLEDLGATREVLGLSDSGIAWSEFVAIVDRLTVDETLPPPLDDPGRISVTTVDEFVGARAGCLILANLTEGTFPAEPPPGRDDAANLSAYRLELERFRIILGSVDDRLILAYPSVDDNGEELLPAGFLDALIRRLPHDVSDVHTAITRFDPALRNRPELAFSPGDQRVLAVAEACERSPDRLIGLARSARHRDALEGAAQAFELLHQRLRLEEFGPFDGKLADEQLLRALAQRFDVDAIFSPSQIETYLYCPFQFYLKYVLKVRPPEDRGELDPDYSRFGSSLHKTLQDVHEALRDSADGGSGTLADRLDVMIKSEVRVELNTLDESKLGLEQSLRELEAERIARVLQGYARDFDEYNKGDGQSFVPSHFEVSFGPASESDGNGVLVLGEGLEAVKLQGTIDRIDLKHDDGGVRFRVIDYKSIGVPGKSDVLSHLYVQLPLYALAVENLGIIDRDDVSLNDFGYWGLKDKGFVPIKLAKGQNWDGVRAEVIEVVLKAVARLRAGDFSINPRKEDCQRSCDFKTTCRIREVRNAGKVLQIELPQAEADLLHNQARD